MKISKTDLHKRKFLVIPPSLSKNRLELVNSTLRRGYHYEESEEAFNPTLHQRIHLEVSGIVLQFDSSPWKSPRRVG